jgi:dolichyl-phosphate beta-glucosyltransferase
MISIVVPCYNEEGRIGGTLEAIVGHLGGSTLDWEILAVDDGSADGTSVVVARAAAREPRIRGVRHERNRGKGDAVRSGFRASRGEWVLFSDADLATPIEELGRMLESGEAGADVVIASRVVPGARIETRQPWRRRLSGAVFRRLVRALGLSSFHDTQCGFKLLRREAILPILEAVETSGFAFDVELLCRAERAGLRVVEIPVRWRDVAGSKLRLFPDAWRMARDLVRMRARPRSLARRGT